MKWTGLGDRQPPQHTSTSPAPQHNNSNTFSAQVPHNGANTAQGPQRSSSTASTALRIVDTSGAVKGQPTVNVVTPTALREGPTVDTSTSLKVGQKVVNSDEQTLYF